MYARDRISDLPEFVLHVILSILDTREACRASVLSKKWFGVWSSIPVLDFQPWYFRNKRGRGRGRGHYDDHSFKRFVGFIDKTMQRYSEHKFRITKLKLNLPDFRTREQTLVDKWIGIAVQSQVEELDIKMSEYNYVLPDVLFNAKSLKVLKCMLVELPYYETMNLISLEHLDLTVFMGKVDEDMLQRIISFCPLAELHVDQYDLQEISLPWTRKVNKGGECSGSGTIQSDLKTSPLRKFSYSGVHEELLWPWNMNVVALKNLKNLKIHDTSITDDIVSELASGLVALESLGLSACSMLKCINISSASLKELRIEDASGSSHLMKATIDAPNLLEFFYKCEVEVTLSLIRVHDHCIAHYFPLVKDTTTDWFVKLKKFLEETGLFKSLEIELSSWIVVGDDEDEDWDAEEEDSENEGEAEEEDEDEDEMRDSITSSPYKLKKLKLRTTRGWSVSQSSLMSYLDGLFLCCHPDVLSITASLENVSTGRILSILKSKVKCWKHPLKSIELEGADCSRLLSGLSESEFEIWLRLTWSSVEPQKA